MNFEPGAIRATTPHSDSKAFILRKIDPRFDGVIVIAMATLAFSLVVGIGVIDPTNLAKVGKSDSVTHFLGWQFFRQSPWTAPLGASPDYGLELSNSIVYSDSIPLLALAAKPFSPWLPKRFQYFGAWLYCCFVLQAWFGWRLASLISDNRAVRILVAAACVFAPPMFMRLRDHAALAGHWMILAAFWLALRPRTNRNGLAWALLIGAAALVHAYFLAITFGVWAAALVGRVWSREQNGLAALREGAWVCAAVAVTTWQAGYFMIGVDDIEKDGLGVYCMNLLSLVDASSWSYVLPDLPEKPGNYEGFNFLGLGYLLAFVSILPALLTGRYRPKLSRKSIPYVVFLAGLVVFSVSHTVSIGSHVLFVVPLPEAILKIASIFRSSGRLFWPVYYSLILSTFYVLLNYYGARVGGILLSILLAVQIADTSAGWLPIRRRTTTGENLLLSSPLKSDFWSLAARRYRKVRLLMPVDTPKGWYVFASYAAFNSMATDAVYLARVDRESLQVARDRASEVLRTGRFEEDALYVLDAASAEAAVHSVDPERDLLARIDGFTVVAPGWKVGAQYPSFGDELRVDGQVHSTGHIRDASDRLDPER